VRNRAKSTELDTLKYCLMDFAKVSGIDSTGMLSFDRMLQWNQEQGIQLVITGMPPVMQNQFLQANSSSNQEALHFLPSLDRGLEWCENEIIHTYLADLQIRQGIANQLNEVLKSKDAERLIPYMERLEYLAGEYLIREGGASDFIYFIHSGQVTAQLETPGQDPIRLETIYSGRAVGEISFYLGTKRTASVIADKDTVVYSLSVNDVDDMEANDPETANIFHRLNVLLLSERVMRLTRTVRALERS
jgi:sulfate permease, SulP family